MKWFRVHNDILQNPKLLMLSPADRWFYIALLSLKSSGIIEKYTGDKLDRVICAQLRITVAEWTETRRRLVDEDLLNNDLEIRGWEHRQYRSDSSTERVQKHRNKMKELRNVSVTPPDTDTDTDTDTDIKPTSSRNVSDPVPYAKIIDLYHKRLPQLPAVQKVTGVRKAAIRQRWKSGDLPALENWDNFFDYIAQSDFLMGRASASNGRKPFTASLEWVTKESNYTKILEGNYHGV